MESTAKKKKIRDMRFEDWFGLNKKRLREDYMDDVFDTLTLATNHHLEYLDDIKSFDQYAKSMFEEEKEDEESGEKNR